MFEVHGPEGDKEGTFDSETDAVDYAVEQAIEFSAPFSVYHEGKCVMTFRPMRKKGVSS